MYGTGVPKLVFMLLAFLTHMISQADLFYQNASLFYLVLPSQYVALSRENVPPGCMNALW